MHPIRERLLDLGKLAARATRLRCVPRIDRYYPNTGAFSLVSEDVEERSPARVVRGFRKSGSGNALDVESFVSNQAVGVYEFASFLVVKVPALISRLLVQASGVVTSFAASCRAFLPACKGSLCPSELRLSLAIVAWWLYRLARGGDKETLQPEIKTYRRALAGSFGRISEVTREDHVPLAEATLHGDGLDRPLNRAMQLDLDVPDVLEVEPSAILEPAPVAVGRKLDGPETTFGLEARVAGRIPHLDPPKERLESLVQPAKRGLSRREVEGREVRENLTTLLEAPRLLAVGDGSFFGLVHVSPIPESKVIQAAVLFKNLIQSLSLGAVRVDPVLVGAPHLLAPRLLSRNVAGYRCLRNVPRRACIKRARPEGRHPAYEVFVSLPQHARGVALELVSQSARRMLRRGLNEQVDVIGLNREVLDLDCKLCCLLPQKLFKIRGYVAYQYRKAVLRCPDEVVVEVGNAARCCLVPHTQSIRDRYKKSTYLTNREGGVRAFLRPLKGAVPCP